MSYAPPILLPSYDTSAISTAKSAIASGTAMTMSSGGGTAGAYGIALLVCSYGSISLNATYVVTWGGVSMTSVGSTYVSGVGGGWLWAFELPSLLAGGAGIPGGSQTISATLTESGQVFTGWISSYSYNNVAGRGPVYTNLSPGANDPVISKIPANPADIIFAAAGMTSPSYYPSSLSPMTTRQGGSLSVVNPGFVAGDGVAGSVLVNATALCTPAQHPWGILAFGLKAA